MRPVLARPALLLALLAACQDAGLQKHNSVPTATITAPADGATFAEGDTVTLAGAVSDPNDEATDLEIIWTVQGATVCPEAAADAAGVTICAITVETGSLSIGLEARDPAGATAVDDITVLVAETGAPAVTLTSPAAGERLYADAPVLLSATATDAEDGPEDLRATWTSTLDGELLGDAALNGDDTTSTFATLSAGTHGITVTVTDTDGKVGSALATIAVGPANTGPTCSITDPGEDAVVEFGETVDLVAFVGDADQPPEELAVAWSSSADGGLGSATPEASGDVRLSVSDLSAGPHTLTLAVEDERGERCTDTLAIVVGSPPTVHITAPADGSTVDEGDPVGFAATVADGQDPASALGLSWTSDRDGVLDTTAASSSGAAGFSTDALSVGAHTVTLTATDTVGLAGSDRRVLTVNGRPSAPTVALGPSPADTTDALVASVTVDSVDPEGSSVAYTWAWTRDGAATSHTGTTVPASDTSRGETWVATATPNDGRADGSPGSASRTIGNAPPVVSSVTLSPTSPQTADTVRASVSSSDPDGDAVTLTYAWTVDGSSVAATGASLSGASFSKGQVVGLTVTPFDGADTGTPVAATAVTVVNTPPTAPGVSLDPASPTESDDIVCTIDTPSTDADADTVTYTITWDVDGVTYPDDALDSGDTGFAWAGPSTTTWTDDTVPAADVALGDTWTCTATPDDGTDTGTAGTASATVSHSACGTATSYAYALTVELYGYCWYLARPGYTCDQVCGDVGGTNLAWSAESAFPDNCSLAGSTDVSTWFYNNGNPGLWTGTIGGTAGHTLGYGYENREYYGKCSTGTSLTVGSYPGEPNTRSNRQPVCPCFP